METDPRSCTLKRLGPVLLLGVGAFEDDGRGGGMRADLDESFPSPPFFALPFCFGEALFIYLQSQHFSQMFSWIEDGLRQRHSEKGLEGSTHQSIVPQMLALKLQIYSSCVFLTTLIPISSSPSSSWFVSQRSL